jgi:hypothetical protein
MAKENGIQWVQNSIKKFISDYRIRVEKIKDFAAGILHNHYYAIKKFIVMNDDLIAGASSINWKKISAGLPLATTFDDDCAPTTNRATQAH